MKVKRKHRRGQKRKTAFQQQQPTPAVPKKLEKLEELYVFTRVEHGMSKPNFYYFDQILPTSAGVVMVKSLRLMASVLEEGKILMFKYGGEMPERLLFAIGDERVTINPSPNGLFQLTGAPVMRLREGMVIRIFGGSYEHAAKV